MTPATLTRELVLERSAVLPAFPPIIRRILDTIDDPDANLIDLVEHIKLDPLIVGRVLSIANSAALHRRLSGQITDLHTATSMIGTESVRNIALTGSFSSLCGKDGIDLHGGFVRHSLSVAVCAIELAKQGGFIISSEMAQIAGLLHDIGHLWLQRFEPAGYSKLFDKVLSQQIDIETAEMQTFGATHSEIGAWLGEYWELPEELVDAIRYHHIPEKALHTPLVPLIHVAEVLSHALELPGQSGTQVGRLSSPACRALGVSWDESSGDLFGRVEARSRYTVGMLN